jgi:hypothetical protein
MNTTVLEHPPGAAHPGPDNTRDQPSGELS